MIGGHRPPAYVSALLAFVAGAPLAHAQNVTQNELAGIYLPLANQPGVTALTDLNFSSSDDGSATVTLPFTYNYLAQPFTRVVVGTNGAIRFGNVSCCSASNYDPASSSAPSNMIAAWWDDLLLPARMGHGSTAVVGVAPSRAFVIELRNWERYGNNNRPEGRYQIWLYEGRAGRFEVRYDGVLSSAEGYNASNGWTGPPGSGLHGTFRDCGTNCGPAEFATMVGRVFGAEVVPGADLFGTMAGFPLGGRRGEDVTGTVTLRNIGSDPTSTVAFSLYLSRDGRLDANDTLADSYLAPAVPIGNIPVDIDVIFTVPQTVALGDYVLILQVDTRNDYPEPVETNNITVADTWFSTTGAPVFIQTERRTPFVPLRQLPGVLSVTDFTFRRQYSGGTPTPDADNGEAELRMPFDYNYLGQRFDRLKAGSNGLIHFGQRTISGEYYNYSIGDTDEPNNMIAVWWDDLAVPAATGFASHATIGSTPNRIFVVEVRDWEMSYSSNLADGDWQVWFYEGESARFDVHYNGSLTPAENYTATAGWEGPGAAQYGAFRPCAEAGYPYCDHTDYATMAGTVFSVRKATAAELIGEIGTFPAGGLAGTTQRGSFTIRNIGVVDTATITSTFYLSTDRVLDAADLPVGSVVVPFLAAGDSLTDEPADIVVPPGIIPGAYHLILHVDSGNTVPEVEESNNVVLGDPFATAYDLSSSAVTLLSGNPGDDVTLDVTVENGAIPFSGQVEIRVYASAERIYDLNDPPLGSYTLDLAGLDSETVSVTVALPANTPPGTYHPIVVLDPANRVREVDEFDNVSAGIGTFGVGPELAADAVLAPAEIRPGDLASITTRIRSLIGFLNRPVEYELLLSADTTRDPQDILLGAFTVTFAGEALLSAVEQVQIPAALAPGCYYILSAIDPDNSIAEGNENDNLGSSGTCALLGTDYTVDDVVFAPLAAQTHDTISVTSRLRRRGSTGTGTVSFAVWLSADGTIAAGGRTRHPSDVKVFEGNAPWPSGDTLNVTADFVPGPQVPIRTWYVFVEVESRALVTEPYERNNWGLAPDRLDMVGPNVRVLEIRGPNRVYGGMPYPLDVTVENSSPIAAGPLQICAYASAGASIAPPMGEVHRSAPVTIAGYSRQSYSYSLTLSFSAPAEIQFGALVDCLGVVPESAEDDNLAVIPEIVRLLVAGPDLTGRITETSTSARAGGSMLVTRELSNAGIAAAQSFELVYYLSTNPSIDRHDVLLGTFTGSLDVGETETTSDRVSIPAGIPAGTYHVGLLLDPSDNLDEVNEENNAILGPALPIDGPELAVTTETLPDAMLGVPYAAATMAGSGPVEVTWSIVRGSLPEGLNMSVTGTISGTPAVEGESSFRVRAWTGASVAERDLSIAVVRRVEPIAIDEIELPAGVVGDAYCTDEQSVQLSASGGVPPFVWSIDGDVPDGLTLSEDGLLCGTPKKAGQLDVLVRVEDSRGATAMAMFSLRIDARLSIATTSLPHGIIRESYSAALESSGGARPVVWQVSSGQLPPGLTLDPSGTISGTPSTAGAYVFTVEVDDSGPQKVSKPLSIRITDGKLPEAEGDGCGCQAAPKARGGAMGMLLLALLTASRPRRRATTRAGG